MNVRDKTIIIQSSVPPPVWLRFTLVCILLLLSAVWAEPYLVALCRLTARQVGALLELSGYAPLVAGDLITVSGFTVQIVVECTPLYACLLYCAFLLARPASWSMVLAGMVGGTLLIATVNLFRIAAITVVGSHVSPMLFQILHVYLGQVIMLLLVLGTALGWEQWNGDSRLPFPFVIRAALVASLLFIPWLAINRQYVALLDVLVAYLFSLLYPGYSLLTPRPFPIYNHTFAVPLFLALVMAGRTVYTVRRLGCIVAAISLIAGWHALFRVSHVIWTALDVPAIAPLHQLIYLIGQFLLPFLLWLLLDGRFSHQEKPFEGRSGPPFVMMIMSLFLCQPADAAAEPVVSAIYAGNGKFSIVANNLNRITEAEIRLNYQSLEQIAPQVSAGMLDRKTATFTVSDNSSGSLVFVIKSSKPLSGYISTASVKMLGTINYLTAVVRQENGMAETLRTGIVNPTDEQLETLGAQRSAKDKDSAETSPRPEKTQTESPPADATSSTQTTTPVPTAPSSRAPAAAGTPLHGKIPKPDADITPSDKLPVITFSRRVSVLERFSDSAAGKKPASLARLLERHDDVFSQDPPLLLADGSNSLQLTVRTSVADNRSPQFIISGGSCSGLKTAEDGKWILEIVPNRGSVVSSVSVLSGTEIIEYPLTVAPLLAEFNEAEAPTGTAAFVRAANELIDSKIHTPQTLSAHDGTFTSDGN